MVAWQDTPSSAGSLHDMRAGRVASGAWVGGCSGLPGRPWDTGLLSSLCVEPAALGPGVSPSLRPI